MKIDEKTFKNNEQIMKTDEKHCKNNEKPCKNNEKPMKIDEKHCKNNEKIMKRFGPRTSTQQLARGLGPIHPGYYNGALQRGNTTGKQKGNKRET